MSQKPISLSYSFYMEAGRITGEPAYTVAAFTRDSGNNLMGR